MAIEAEVSAEAEAEAEAVAGAGAVAVARAGAGAVADGPATSQTTPAEPEHFFTKILIDQTAFVDQECCKTFKYYIQIFMRYILIKEYIISFPLSN